MRNTAANSKIPGKPGFSASLTGSRALGMKSNSSWEVHRLTPALRVASNVYSY